MESMILFFLPEHQFSPKLKRGQKTLKRLNFQGQNLKKNFQKRRGFNIVLNKTTWKARLKKIRKVMNISGKNIMKEVI